jgi:hypothetical protein
MATRSLILLQPFQHSLIIRSSVFIGIRVDDERDLRVDLSEAVQKVLEFGVDDDQVNFGMVKNVGDVVLLQAVIDRYGSGQQVVLPNCRQIFIPTLTAAAAPIP